MSIVLERLQKRYDRHLVVNNVSLEVANGEFFVLLGPSGSGKSTVLRMIAGLTATDQGEIVLNGRRVTDLPPQKRGVGFVFQNYALFRHMTVSENIEFPLRIRKTPSLERRRRRDDLLELVGLAGLGGRMPRQLSGGQQQRVALARALAHEPEVLLLDEPFGALDAKIRVDIRRTVRDIQRKLGITLIFVTHDQEEAFELADRMGLMNFGRLLEVGPPQELYLRPQTEFAATFLGTANLIVGERTPSGIRVGPLEFPVTSRVEPGGGGGRVQVLFRPEDVAVKVTSDALSWPLFGEAVVDECHFTGSFERLRLRIPNLSGVRAISPPVPFGGDFVLVEASRTQDHARRYPLRRGDTAWVGVRRIHALTHPGLSFLITTDGAPASRAAMTLGGQIARLAHARVTLLGHGPDRDVLARVLQEGKEQIGGGLPSFETRSSPDPAFEAIAREVSRRPYDLIVQAFAPSDPVAQAEEILRAAGDPHLLLVPALAAVPAKVLICVSVGEPGKAGVLFAGRLVRHLEAQATILTVLPEGSATEDEEQAMRFLAAGARTLSQLGVPAATALGVGTPRNEILSQTGAAGHDLIVIGTPLDDRKGRGSLKGLVGGLIETMKDIPILLVRSRVQVQ